VRATALDIDLKMTPSQAGSPDVVDGEVDHRLVVEARERLGVGGVVERPDRDVDVSGSSSDWTTVAASTSWVLPLRTRIEVEKPCG